MSGRAARASKARKRWYQSESKAWERLPEHGPFAGEHDWSDVVAWQLGEWLFVGSRKLTWIDLEGTP